MTTELTDWKGRELAGGRYRIALKLGEGGMGVAYRAWDRNLETDVVIKVPRPTLVADSQLVPRFNREVRSLVRLAHPHIVKVLDVGEEAGLPYAVMQYLSGGDLRERQTQDAEGRRVPMRPESVPPWLERIADALDFIHQQNYIHRDVKPANILFDGYGNVYLSDFGVAKALANLAAEGQPHVLTAMGMVIGTPGYMSPELIMGESYDGKSDQFALAVTVYEMVAGRSPFDGMPVAAILGQVIMGKILPAKEALPTISRSLSAAIEKAMAKDPEHRFPSCSGFARAVSEAVRAGSDQADVVVPVPAMPEEPALALEPVPPVTPKLESVRLHCPDCQRPLRLPAETRGKRVRCPGCSAMLAVSMDLRYLLAVATPESPLQAERLRRSCPACRKVISLRAEVAGKRVRCNGCQSVLLVAPDLGGLTVLTPQSGRPAVALAVPVVAVATAERVEAGAADTRPGSQAQVRTEATPVPAKPAALPPRVKPRFAWFKWLFFLSFFVVMMIIPTLAVLHMLEIIRLEDVVAWCRLHINAVIGD